MAKSEPQPACIHHWVIETANGPTSQGMCATCGSTREFWNSVAEKVAHINLKDKDDEPSNGRISWMQSWPPAQIKNGSKKK